METAESPPELLESSDDEESVPLKGVFPWGFRKTRHHTLQVSMWLQLEKKYRSDALHASMVKLMSPFLFLADSELSAKWQDWSKTLQMLGLPKTTVNDPDQFEQGLYCCRMLLEAHRGIEKLAQKRNDLIAILEFVCTIDQEYQQSDLTRVISVARGQEQIKFLCDSMSSISKKYSSPETVSAPSSKGPRTWFERRVFAALLAGKQFSDVIHKLTFEGCDIVSQLNIKLAQTGKMLKFKDLGNNHFKKNNFTQALGIYTGAINDFPFSSVLYCNRCITLIKLEQFKLAVADGYRATCLTPRWGKAYFRRAEALKLEGRLDWAVETACHGFDICDSKDKNDFEKLLFNLRESALFDIRKEGTKPRTLKSTRKRIPSQDDPPDLVSDDDSIASLSDNEYSRAKRKMKKAEKKKDMSKSQIKSKDVVEKLQTKRDRKENNSTDRGSQKGDGEGRKEHKEIAREKPQRKPHKQNSREDINKDKKPEEEKPRPVARVVQQPPVELKLFIGDVYQGHVSNASRALLEGRFDVATNEYDAAMRIVAESTQKEWKITAVENFVVIYARGVSSLETRLPQEVARSLDFFARIVRPSHKEYCHPMAFYAAARAHYTLNNFSKVAPAIEGGMQLLRKKKFPGVLTWPGLNDAIPESDVNALKLRMEEIVKWSHNPPKATVYCIYDNCAKEYSRREIYKNDLDFEGFIEVMCDWECSSSFHFKCWSKYKHAQYGRSGDKELLGLDCFTDGCGGIICHIKMIDESFELKKDARISVSKRVAEKGSNSSKEVGRTSKSERNLERRRRLMKEAKERKKSYKVADTIYETTEDQEEKKITESTKINDVSHSNVTSVTVIKREEENKNEILKPAKGKGKGKSKKKSSNVVSLQTFLGNDKHANHDDAWRAAERSQNSDTPFQIPAEYRANVLEFETTISEEQQLKLSSLHSFFEEFYKRNGPLLIDDRLFKQEITPDMLLLSDLRFPNFIDFLLSKTETFCRVGDYIGLVRQREAMQQLAGKTNHKQPIKQPEKRPETPQRHTTSAFTQELYVVGDVPLSEVQNFLGVDPNTGSSKILNTNGAREPSAKATDFSKIVTLEQKAPAPVATLNVSEDSKRRGAVQEAKKTAQAASIKTSKGATHAKKEEQKSVQHIASLSKNESKHTAEKTAPHGKVDPPQKKGSAPMTGNSPWSPVPVKIDVTVQTELMPSYESEISALKLEKTFLLQRNEELTDKFAQLSNTSRAEVALLSKELDGVRDELKATEHKLTMVTLNAETDAKKYAREKAVWAESAKAAKKQQQESQESETELKEALEDKKKEVENLSLFLQDEREKWMKTKSDNTEEVKKLEAKLKEFSERAVAAEVGALRTKEGYVMRPLVVAKVESDKFAKDFEQMAMKYTNYPLAKNKVLEASLRWKKNAEDCQMKLDVTHKMFNDQIQDIICGKKLSELPNIVVPNPPPPGPNLHQIQAVLRSVPLAMMPKVGIPLPHPNDQNSNPMPTMSNSFADPSRNVVQPVSAHAPVSASQVPIPPDEPWTNQATVNGRESLTSTPNSHPPSPGPAPPSTSRQQNISPTISTPNQQPTQQNHVPATQNHHPTAPRPQPIQPPNQQIGATHQPAAPKHQPQQQAPAESSQPAAPQRSQTAPQHKGSFERIMDQLRKMYPNVPRTDIAQCIKEVRQNNNNSLTGLSFEDIVKQATVVISRRLSKKQGQAGSMNSAPSRSANTSSVAPWMQSRQNNKPKNMQETNEDEPCVICHDPLASNETHKLLCGHVFHSECLNKWLTRNRTCPTCRDYAIDTSEYPTLKSTYRR